MSDSNWIGWTVMLDGETVALNYAPYTDKILVVFRVVTKVFPNPNNLGPVRKYRSETGVHLVDRSLG